MHSITWIFWGSCLSEKVLEELHRSGQERLRSNLQLARGTKNPPARFLLFSAGGVLAVLVDGFVYWNLVVIFSDGGSIAPKALSFMAGAFLGYAYQARVTFGFRYSVQTALRFFFAITVVGAMNVYLNEFLIGALRGFTLYVLPVAFFCSTGISAVLNYILQSRLVFSKDGTGGSRGS